MDYLLDYLSFAAKLVTVVVMIAIPLAVLISLRFARQTSAAGNLEIKRVNDALKDTTLALESQILPAKAFKQRLKDAKKEHKTRDKSTPDPAASRTYALSFNGDIQASQVSELREEITAILNVVNDHDEVVVTLESGGGTVHGYGLAASQLKRIRDRGIRLVVVVDKIAASGGYMMACVADEIVAAPFAIIGSIGVVAQLPNFHRLLKKHDIDFEQITAGEFKRTLTLFGENTDADREKFQDDIDQAHGLFKSFIADCRPSLDLETVATGEYWFASRALELGLVDRLATSDEVIAEAAKTRDVFSLSAMRKRSWLERLGKSARAAASQFARL